MKNSILALTMLLFIGLGTSYAQVGVGTTNPEATLDVRGANDNSGTPGAVAAEDGVLVPRVDETDMSSATAGQADGQLVYNVNDNTFYFWNASTNDWKAVGGGDVRTTGTPDFVAADLNGYIIVTANVTFTVTDVDLAGAQPGDTITMMRDDGSNSFSVNDLTLGSLGSPIANGGALTIFFDGSGWRTISGF